MSNVTFNKNDFFSQSAWPIALVLLKYLLLLRQKMNVFLIYIKIMHFYIRVVICIHNLNKEKYNKNNNFIYYKTHTHRKNYIQNIYNLMCKKIPIIAGSNETFFPNC